MKKTSLKVLQHFSGSLNIDNKIKVILIFFLNFHETKETVKLIVSGSEHIERSINICLSSVPRPYPPSAIGSEEKS